MVRIGDQKRTQWARCARFAMAAAWMWAGCPALAEDRPVDAGRSISARLLPAQASDSLPPVVASRSAIVAELEANRLWKQGDKFSARALLYRQASDAAPADAAAARLRLGYLHHRDKNTEEARRLFLAVAEQPSGVNDRAKTDAAFRIAYTEKARDARRLWFERLVSGEFAVSKKQRDEAALMLGGLAHADLDLARAADCYRAIADATESSESKSKALASLAGVTFEQAKGEGKNPIPPSERPAAWQRAAQLCDQVIAMEGDLAAPRDRIMVAELMRLEIEAFNERHEAAFERGQAFLGKWSGQTEFLAKSREARRFLTCGKTFTMMSGWLAGHDDTALALAEGFLTTPPAPKDTFSNLDSVMYSAVISAEVAAEAGMSDVQGAYATAGRERNSVHFSGLGEALRARRAGFRSRVGLSPAPIPARHAAIPREKFSWALAKLAEGPAVGEVKRAAPSAASAKQVALASAPGGDALDDASSPFESAAFSDSAAASASGETGENP